ncbi:alpha-N-arabinofuranosidase [Cladophialophora carrionii]|uniref:Alpha-N-arabinofuranosidase n=1 Tax=Cladophialophora carrionii TaxID=86049 RepID=A0A1C1CFB9_9EURO|nr:alpha-N-arabinofuranosidase [Cladophialophora carrionii]
MSNQTISDQDTPDPWMISHGPNFYLTFTAGDRIEIWRSPNMEDFRSCARTIAWRPGPADHPWFVDLWAPELHFLDSTWYVYFTGAKPRDGPGMYNADRRTLLLRSRSRDPMEAGAWEFLGRLGGLPDHWNIDATVFRLPQTGRLYCCYSGWPAGDFSDRQQDLFLAEMDGPEAAKPDTVVCISRAELAWERADQGTHGVNEGPAFVSVGMRASAAGSGAGSAAGSGSVSGEEETTLFQGIVYSANGSWTSDYRLGILQLVDGAHPLRQSSWRKRPTPLLVSDRQHGGPFGPGHASFIPSSPSDGRRRRVYCIYHATEHFDQGWANRKARVLSFSGEHFHPQAPTMCCALALSGQWSGGAAISNVSSPSSASSAPAPAPAPAPAVAANGAHQAQQIQNQRAHGPRKSIVDRIGDKILQKLREFA